MPKTRISDDAQTVEGQCAPTSNPMEPARQSTNSGFSALVSADVEVGLPKVWVPSLRDVLHAAAGSKSRADILAMLGRPLTWGAVSHWLSGRRPMPSWAVERVQRRLRAMQERVQAVEARPCGPIGTQALARYRANKHTTADRSPRG
jgi:hypothetical protein